MMGTHRQQPAPSPIVMLQLPPDEKLPPPDAPATPPASLRRQAWPAPQPQALEIVEMPPGLTDVRIVVQDVHAEGVPALAQAQEPEPGQAAPATCASKAKAVCVGAARVIGAVVAFPFALVGASISTAGCVLAGAIDLVTCCRFRLVDRHCCDD